MLPTELSDEQGVGPKRRHTGVEGQRARKREKKVTFLEQHSRFFDTGAQRSLLCLRVSFRPLFVPPQPCDGLALRSFPSHPTRQLHWAVAHLPGALQSCHWTFVHTAKPIPRHVKGTDTGNHAVSGCLIHLPILKVGENIVFAH